MLLLSAADAVTLDQRMLGSVLLYFYTGLETVENASQLITEMLGTDISVF